MLRTVLVANRGEIACRIIRTAKRVGLRTVAVYSEADICAQHVEMADEAISIGPAAAAESYLNPDRILDAARSSASDAIHPGYGFLSENAAFARACKTAGVTFVGPQVHTIETMGDKAQAKQVAEQAGVPVLSGFLSEDQSVTGLVSTGTTLGFPLIIKPVSGGGGKGMHIARTPTELQELVPTSQREAKAAFGDNRLLLERYLDQPRHIEVQIFGDRHGNIVHMFERDCSLQRRHQKVIEEAPAQNLRPRLRAQLTEAAVAIAKTISYCSAGTVEFLVSGDEFFFMEMNTRLQVEHPVTEEITGVDLVEWQLRVASGEPIPLSQEDLFIDGHAIEARLYAEDPAGGFLPSTGALDHFDLGVEGRIETGVEEGDRISPFYDPMVAKLVVWGETRGDAIDQLAGIAENVEIWPVKTNAAFIANCLRDEDFEQANLDTGFIETKLDDLVSSDEADDDIWQSAADFIALAETEDHEDLPIGLRLNAPGVLSATLTHKGETRTVSAARAGTESFATGFVDPARAVVFADGQSFVFERQSRGSGAAAAGDGAILAPMPGKVIAVDVAEGDTVTAGQRLMVLEAMKMEHALTAPFDGTVTELAASEGGQVQVEAVLAVVEPKEE